MIVASLLGMVGAMVTGVPVGLFTAILLSELAKKRLAAFLRGCMELMAGIPSVVYGFFGLTVIVPFIRVRLGSPTDAAFLHDSYSVLIRSCQLL